MSYGSMCSVSFIGGGGVVVLNVDLLESWNIDVMYGTHFRRGCQSGKDHIDLRMCGENGGQSLSCHLAGTWM